jgi:glycerol-1-phosphate dehydrogenase [NAD(P)+]
MKGQMGLAELIEDVLEGRWRDPATGRAPALPSLRIVIEPSLDGREAELVAALRLGPRLAVVSDPRTHAALGARVASALDAIATIDEIVLAEPEADLATVEQVIARSRHAVAFIAVGSGTLNDVCKYAAFTTGRPSAVFATAPSMNGYVTGTASLSSKGLKTTLEARAPRAVFLDLDVLRHAPVRLIRAGLGDAICRTTAEVDWLLSHLLLGTPYSKAPFLLQADVEGPMLDAAAALAQRQPDAVLALTRMLVLSGLGMAIAGGSEPASQGEHLISHYIDTMAGEGHPGSRHGEQVGVATLTVSRLQNRLLRAEAPPVLHPSVIDERAILARFGPTIGPRCLAALMAKALDRRRADALNAKLADEWPDISRRLQTVMLPLDRLQGALAAAGAPLAAEDLGLDPSFYRAAVLHAREIRNRFTILDLAADSGLLSEFATGEGIWRGAS